MYVIVAEPPEMPVTIPDAEPTVAMPVLLLVHEPPVVASESVDVSAKKMLVVPVIAAGAALMVTTDVA